MTGGRSGRGEPGKDPCSAECARGGGRLDRVSNADDELALRAAVAAEFGVWSAAEAGRRIGSRGHSPAAAIRRWAAQGKLLTVPVAGLDHYPGFAFGLDGRPRSVLVRVASAVPERTGWALVAWLVSPQDALGGARPVDLLETNPDAVVAAATAS
jgi:hypothetical protein